MSAFRLRLRLCDKQANGCNWPSPDPDHRERECPQSTHTCRSHLLPCWSAVLREADARRAPLLYYWGTAAETRLRIDIETCSAFGGALRIIARIEDPAVIKKILTHLDTKDASTAPVRLPPSRAPPQAGLFD